MEIAQLKQCPASPDRNSPSCYGAVHGDEPATTESPPLVSNNAEAEAATASGFDSSPRAQAGSPLTDATSDEAALLTQQETRYDLHGYQHELCNPVSTSAWPQSVGESLRRKK